MSFPAANIPENGRKVLEKRYILKDAEGNPLETVEGLFERVSNFLAAQVTHEEDTAGLAKRFYEAMAVKRWFLPNSPTLANADARTGMLSACFVFPISDCLTNGVDGIFDTVKWQAVTQQAGGGSGFAFSKLRPRRSQVGRIAGQASGPVSFMEFVYNTSTEAVKQGGLRRGANMGVLDCSHPDILEFIHCKANKTRITNFNISVAISDEFMRCLEAGERFQLKDPTTGEPWRGPVYGPTPETLTHLDPVLEIYSEDGTVDPRDIWDVLCKKAWLAGEPGVLFLDEANRYNPVPWRGQYIATNPCFAPGTMILTRAGHFPIEELVGKEVEIWDGDNWVRINNFRVTGRDVQTYHVILRSGERITATMNHTFVMEDGSRKELHQLEEGDRLMGHNVQVHGNQDVPGAYFLGFLAGDGGTIAIREKPELWLYEPKFMCADRLMASASELPVGELNTNAVEELRWNVYPSSPNRKHMTGLVARKVALQNVMQKDRLPAGILNWSLKSKAEFVAGYFDADGTVTDSKNGYGYQLGSVNKGQLDDLQALLKSMGVRSKVSLNKPGGMHDFGDKGGWCYCQPLYRIVVAQVEASALAKVVTFSRLKSFANYGSTNQFKRRDVIIDRIEMADWEDKVYCCTVPGSHRVALSNGIVTAQCSEQVLQPYEPCNLVALNLESFVNDSGIDLQAFQEAVYLATIYANAVIDGNKYPRPQGEPDRVGEVARSTRKIGIGIMGFARMLYRLEIRYGSEESILLAKALMAFIDAGTLHASAELAKKVGKSYPDFEDHREESIAFHTRVTQERLERIRAILMTPHLPPKVMTLVEHAAAHYDEAQELIQEGWLYNSNGTTIAPTGTISIIHNTSGGCEPEFALIFQRNQAGMIMLEGNALFEQAIRATNEFWNEDPNVSEVLLAIQENHGSLVEAVNNNAIPPELHHLAKVFVVAHDVTPQEHVLIQAAFQEFNQSSLSKTINLPETATVEDVDLIYRMAYQHRCKGVTVYRNNSRDFQPLANVQTEKKDTPKVLGEHATQIVFQNPPPRRRDEFLQGVSKQTDTHEGKLYTFVGFDAEGPREVVANLGKGGGVLNSMVEAIGRLISLCLKFRVPVAAIVSQLIHIRGGEPHGLGRRRVLSVPDAIAKAILAVPAPVREVTTTMHIHHHYQETETDFGGTPECPECGGPLHRTEGCMTCEDPECGYSKCS